MGLLFCMLAGAVYVFRRARRRPAETPPPPVRVPAAPARIDPFAVPRLAFTGPGGGDAVRALILDLLTERPSEPIEVVVPRTDVAELLGLFPTDLTTERIPGLKLVDDFPDVLAHLRRHEQRRMLVVCVGVHEGLYELCRQQSGHTAVITLSPWTYPTVDVDGTGKVIAASEPDLLASLPATLPLVLPEDCVARLTDLPTVSVRPTGPRPS
ncbi:hypothetical protein ACIBF1_08455 [Spirillospora sp. NPDC050679]